MSTGRDKSTRTLKKFADEEKKMNETRDKFGLYHSEIFKIFLEARRVQPHLEDISVGV